METDEVAATGLLAYEQLMHLASLVLTRGSAEQE